MSAKPHKTAQNRHYEAFMLTKPDLCQYNLAETKVVANYSISRIITPEIMALDKSLF